MAKLFNANEIAEDSLRKVGAYSINDSAARPEELALALNWLDLNMAEFVGRRQAWWLVPETISLPLTSGQGRYDLTTILGGLADDGFAFPISARLNRLGRDLPVEIIARHVWEAHEDKTTAGQPVEVYIDRQRDPVIQLYPVPAESGLTLELTFQTFAPSVSGGDKNDHMLRLTWQRWAIYRVAADISDGTVRMLPAGEQDRFEGKAKEAETALIAFDNQEHNSKPDRVARVDY